MAFEQSYHDDHHYVWRNVVRAAETDLQGVVFYGEYVTYQDETATAYLRDIGIPYQDIGDNWDMHVVNVDINYRSTASLVTNSSTASGSPRYGTPPSSSPGGAAGTMTRSSPRAE